MEDKDKKPVQEAKLPTKEVFCANEQKDTDHTVDFVNGEYVLTCGCGRFIKLAGDLTKDQVREALEKHGEVNQGQVTQAAVDKEKEEKLKSILDA